MAELVAVKNDESLVVDGKRAYLPHPIFQSTLFAATRVRQDGEYRKGMPTTVVHTNRFGDTLTVFAPRTLFVSPDMGVFLATVACAQKAGVHQLVDSETGEFAGISMSKFPLSWLYDLTGMSSQGKSWYQLRSSLEVLSQVSIIINLKDTKEKRRRYGVLEQYSVRSLWSVDIERHKGRRGSMVRLFPSALLVPSAYCLWANAELCNKLKRDTSKGIFWQLICREHLTGTAEDWRKWLNAEGNWETKKWKSAQLMPALEELAGYGYRIKENGDEITVERPGVEPKRLSKVKRKR